MREKILLGGDTNTSKTMSLIQLALIYPERKIIILDPDDGVEKVVDELGFEGYLKLEPDSIVTSRDQLPNLLHVPITPDFLLLLKQYKMIKPLLIPDDWLCMDMMARFWDFAQNFYSRTVLNKSLAEHLLNLKSQAKAVNFSGFDGLSDWPTIKRLHNEELVDDALLWSKFNVMATTSVASYLPVEKIPKAGIEGVIASKFGVKFEGEKHNLYRFDTIALMTRKPNNTFFFRLAKDKGRSLNMDQEFDITGSSFWAKYLEYRGRTT